MSYLWWFASEHSFQIWFYLNDFTFVFHRKINLCPGNIWIFKVNKDLFAKKHGCYNKTNACFENTLAALACKVE